MQERDITLRQILDCLLKGTISDGPTMDIYGNWKMDIYRAADDLTRAVAIEWRSHLIVITAFWVRHALPLQKSGLDDVVLQRGYTIRQTPYGETVAIHDVNRLHRKIAAKLAKQPQLTGAELRFLRLEMDKTQAALADLLGTSEQTLSLWERERKKPIPETAAKLLQVIVDVLLVNHFMMKRGAIGKAIKKGLKLGTVVVLRSHRARLDDDAVRMPAGVVMRGELENSPPHHEGGGEEKIRRQSQAVGKIAERPLCLLFCVSSSLACRHLPTVHRPAPTGFAFTRDEAMEAFARCWFRKAC